MIDSRRLLGDCQRLVRALEDDLRERLAEHPTLAEPFTAEFQSAKAHSRTGSSFAVWRDEQLTQVAVHWVLAAVFVRFLEDQGLFQDAWLAGPPARLAEARERQERFFAEQPAASDRDYLLAAFRAVAALPAMAPLFDERHNPLFRLGPSADGARALLDLFRRLDDAGALVHDFTDKEGDTRFLGDLYQDLSEAARKRFALLQTPVFVEEFLLDRTLEPALAERDLATVRLIDPACGSGHFLLGAFARLFARWQAAEPDMNERELARRALDAIAGVDLNPFAVAIARFRLLVAALRASHLRRLADAPAFPLHLAAGDSLLHGRRPGYYRNSQRTIGDDPLAHVYETEDKEALREILEATYTVVVANPPYITPKDANLNEAYRDRFGSCSGKYSLAVPFTERFFDLAERGQENIDRRAGWVGVITANSFMKREFGKKLIEQYLPKWDLTHVIDTSGAYLPGHGTPTVILIGRNRAPLAPTVRAVMGIRGEPSTPQDPSHGEVWTAIVRQVDFPGSESGYVSVADLERERLAMHPWSIGGGGAAGLKELLEDSAEMRLGADVAVIGVFGMTNADEVMLAPGEAFARRGVEPPAVKPLATGDSIRDWSIEPEVSVIFPYKDLLLMSVHQLPGLLKWLWPSRTVLGTRVTFAKLTYFKEGRPWWEWHQAALERLRPRLSFTFAFVATHNHFVLDRGGKVFNRTAPVIKLPEGATEDDHLALLGLLNSSSGCFWMKQVFFERGNGGIGGGIASEGWERFFEHDGTKLLQFPLPTERPLALARDLDHLATDLAASAPQALLRPDVTPPPTRADLDAARDRSASILCRMIAHQEELDWQTYRLYGLTSSSDRLEADPDLLADLPEIALGERPFEIALARRVAAGEIETQWFARHGSTPIIHLPDRWPAAYRELIERRLRAIADRPSTALIEQPEYKRRWNREPWASQEREALRAWLLDRLEDRRYWPAPRVASAAALADRARLDPEFLAVAALYRGRDDYDTTELITELALAEAVPYLAAWRYTEAGLRKRAEWEETWRLQRLEDAIDARTSLPPGDPERLTEAEAKAAKAREVGDLPAPPRYASADFRKPAYWRLRGKLDVPKERFLHYPGLERATDSTPVLGWAGWTAVQQAEALGTAYHDLRENEAWTPEQTVERLTPLLAGLSELVPWLLQWHNDPDPHHAGLRLGDYYASYVDEEARELGLSREAMAGWKPAAGGGRSRKN